MPPYSDGNKLVQKDPLPFMESDSALANVELWVQQQNASLQEGPFSPSFGPPGKQARSKSGSGGQQRWMPSPNRGPMVSSIGDFMGPGGEQMLIPSGYLNDGQMPRGMPPGQNLDENLTPEQLQRREEQLAQLQKIKNMLFPEKRNEFDPRRPQGMFPGPPRPGPDNVGMMGFPRFPHPNMMPMQAPLGMMEPPDGMMGMPMEPGFFGQQALPPNWENMTPEEREWFKLQHEYYLERQKSQMQMGGGPGFFNELPPRMPGPMSPMSPSFNGSGPPNAQGFFYQGPPGMNFPPNGHGPEFHPDFMPGMGEGVFPFDNGGPVRINQGGHDPGGPVGMGPFPPGARFPNVCKQKRRRPIGDKTDDIYRHLQPAPSPQQFCSLNLFEGQELTITRQLNLAYQEPGYPSPSQSTPTQPRKKKKGDPSSKQKIDEQKSNKSELPLTPELFSSASSLLSPLPQTNVSTPNTNTTTPKLTLSPAAVEQSVGSISMDTMTASASVSGTNTSTAMDIKRQLQADHVAGCSTSSSTPSTSSTNSSVPRNPSVLNNITSATLASLAKGVESLSDRMQMDMKQGGPFRTVQMPENELELSGDSSSGGNLVSLPGSAASVKLENTGTKTPQLSLDGCLQSARTNSERSSGSNPEGLSGSDGNCGGGNDEAKERLVSDGPVQSMSAEGLEVPPSNKVNLLDGSGIPVCNPKRSSPGSVQNITPVTSMLSPNIIGNANVQIEARAPNTIQYLPAVPCGQGPEAAEDPANACVTMPFDSAQLMRDGTMQPGPGPSNPPGSGPGYGGPMHGYDGGPPPGSGGMIHGYDGPMHGPAGPMPGFDGPMLVRNGLMPGFDVPMHGQGGFGPGFDGPVHGPGGPGSLPPYSEGSMHGPGVPMSGFDGPMQGQIGPMPGFNGNGGPMPGFSGPPMHGPVCSMPGFEGQCGPMSEFDMPMHAHGGPMGPGGPHMPGYAGPVPGFSGSLPRHGGPMPNHCGGPMPGCHGGPPMMNMPPNQQMFLPGRGGPLMTSAGEPGMPITTEGQRVKPETTRKEKDRKRRSEAAKKNSGSVGFMEAAAREGRRMNPDAMGALGPGGGRMRGGPGMLRMGPVEGGMGPGFVGMSNMEGRLRPGMMAMGLVEGGMRPGMMGLGPVDGGIRPGMMGMVPMEGGMGPGMMGLVHEEAAMRSGMMGMECEGGMRPGMMGIGPMEGGMRPGMMGMGPMEGGTRPGMMGMGPMDGRPGMMGMEGGMRPEMMSLHPGDGSMLQEHGIMGMGPREPGMSIGPQEPGMPSSSRMMSMAEGSVRPASNTMVMSPGGNSMRPSSRAIMNSDGRPRQSSAPTFSGEPGGISRSVEGNLIVQSPRMEDSRPEMMMMMGSAGESTKRMISSAGSAEAAMRPGSGLMTSLDHGDPSSLRPGSRPLSERMIMGVPGESGMRPGSAMMMGMVDGGVRPGSALMMGMGHGGDPGGMRPGSAMMMAISNPGEGGMRPGSAIMMGVGPEGMRPGPGMMPGMGPGENAMRQNAEMIGMGPGGGMRPGSSLMMSMGGGPGDDLMRMGSEMMSLGPGEGRLRMGPEMIGMGHRIGIGGRMMDIGFCDPRVGPDGGGGGGGGMMGMQQRVGRMDPGMPMMDMRNGGIFPNSSNADPNRRPPPGLDSERFGMAPTSMGEEPFNSAQFQQFQQQLYAKNHSQQQLSPTMEMRGLPPGSMGFDMMRNGPNFGPHGGSLVHGGPPMGMGR